MITKSKGSRPKAIRQAIGKPKVAARQGLFWDKAARQWATRIGYDLNLETGRRVRVSVQRLGADDDAAIVGHAGLQNDWNLFVDRWQQLREIVRPQLPSAIRETAELEKPFWCNAFIEGRGLDQAIDEQRRKLATTAITGASKLADLLDAAKNGLNVVASPSHDVLSLLPPELRARVFAALQPTAAEAHGILPTAEAITLAEALKRYKKMLASREGLGGEDGLKAKSINGYTEAVDRCLSLTVKDPATGTAVLSLAPKTAVGEITFDVLQGHRNRWMRSVADGSHNRRTAANYLRGLRKLLDFCHRSAAIAYRHPADIDELFMFKKLPHATPPKYEDGIAQVKAILTAEIDSSRGKRKFLKSREKATLYTLLALNTGGYPSDIGGLKLSEIREIGGEHFIVRRRSKTSHQNNFETTHYLWPETWEHLCKQLASSNPRKNPLGLALLDEGGRPLYLQTTGRAAKDLIGKVFRSVRKAAIISDAKGNPAAGALEFKQLRKLGATWMENNFDGQARRMYKAGTLQDGDQAYVQDDFTKLTSALKKWGRALRADKILI